MDKKTRKNTDIDTDRRGCVYFLRCPPYSLRLTLYCLLPTPYSFFLVFRGLYIIRVYSSRHLRAAIRGKYDFIFNQ